MMRPGMSPGVAIVNKAYEEGLAQEVCEEVCDSVREMLRSARAQVTPFVLQ